MDCSLVCVAVTFLLLVEIKVCGEKSLCKLNYYFTEETLESNNYSYFHIPSHQYCFDLCASSGRAYLFAADTPEESQQWMVALAKVSFIFAYF